MDFPSIDDMLPDPNPDCFGDSPSSAIDILDLLDFDLETIQNKNLNTSNPTFSESNLGDLLPFSGIDDDAIMYFLDNNLVTTVPFDNPSQSAVVPPNPPIAQQNHPNHDQLQFISQPRPHFRARYASEMDKLRNQAHRFLQTDMKKPHDHPTLAIPSRWLNHNHQYYVRVTLVTVISKTLGYHCIHPYEITATETGVIQDKTRNTLYFPITDHDRLTGEKTFLISLIKATQTDLKQHRNFRIFDLNPEGQNQYLGSNQFDIPRIQNLNDPKEIISVYQLNKFQLVFSIVELQHNEIYFPESTILTHVMHDTSANNSNSSSEEFNTILCIPQRGSWEGNEYCVIIMPNSIRKKKYSIRFLIADDIEITVDNIKLINPNTLLFQIPTCPIPEGNDNREVSIVLLENRSIICEIPFEYITPYRCHVPICSQCRKNEFKDSVSNKRWHTDNAASLTLAMNGLSLNKKPQTKISGKILCQNNSLELENYIFRTNDAINHFIRTNDPSRLFRRTRAVLSQYAEKSLLCDAIEQGNTDTVSVLIQQLIDMTTESRLLKDENELEQTPLLVAAKCNQRKILECILKKQSIYAKQKDKHGNNLLHLLANCKNDQTLETIESVLTILSDEIKNHLIKDTNEKNETPFDIAQSNDNGKIQDLFRASNTEKN